MTGGAACGRQPLAAGSRIRISGTKGRDNQGAHNPNLGATCARPQVSPRSEAERDATQDHAVRKEGWVVHIHILERARIEQIGDLQSADCGAAGDAPTMRHSRQRNFLGL